MYCRCNDIVDSFDDSRSEHLKLTTSMSEVDFEAPTSPLIQTLLLSSARAADAARDTEADHGDKMRTQGGGIHDGTQYVLQPYRCPGIARVISHS